jgi:NADH-quinone oxidoreductase subunit E
MAEPVIAYSAAPAMKPGEAWTGEIKGRAPQRFDLTAERTVAAPAIESIAPEPIAADEPVAAIVEPINEPIAAAPIIAPEPEPSPVVAPPSPPPAAEYDEDAAMRAIEGGWSRTRARAMPGAPELADVGAAVAAAQTAVEQVLAQAGIDPETTKHAGKPAGLPKPRPTGKDNLKQINGLSPLDESTLNNLGVYHFDQISAWDETEVLWMENHVFARGRIGREDWQGQARTLSSVVTG